MELRPLSKLFSYPFSMLLIGFVYRYLFRSGNAEHPSDKFYNTTVEVLPQSTNSVNRNHNNVTEDGYIIIGRFDSLGIARGTVDKKLGKIAVLRLTVHSESDNWAILSEVSYICLKSKKIIKDCVLNADFAYFIYFSNTYFQIHIDEDSNS